MAMSREFRVGILLYGLGTVGLLTMASGLATLFFNYYRSTHISSIEIGPPSSVLLTNVGGVLFMIGLASIAMAIGVYIGSHRTAK